MIAAYRSLVGRLERFPDTPGFFARHLAPAWRQLAVLLVLGLVLRGATFGDTNLHVDESFYFLVGQEMHRGAIPYVDIWDRKPIGLFLIYYAIAGISTSVIAYQLAAWLAASATAWVIALIARRWTGVQGGLLAGAAYLLMLPLFEGWGGQAPVFYNLPVAAAALLILDDHANLDRGRAGWRCTLAMALCGLAITMKQTVGVEAAFFGLYATWRLWRGGPGFGAVLAPATWIALGLLPTAAVALTYLHIGHWPEWWRAMVTSNLAKTRPPILEVLLNILRIILWLYPLLGLAVPSLVTEAKEARPFVGGWIGASFLGILAVPNFYGHYALPILVPLAVASAPFLGRRDAGVFLITMIALFSLVLYNPFNFAETRQARAAMSKMAAAIRQHDSGGGLFVSDGPVYLYALADKHPPSPLTFPPHLNEWMEHDASHLKTDEEVRRILARGPGVVVLSVFPRTNLSDERTHNATLAYAQKDCQLVEVQSSYEVVQKFLIAVYGKCRRPTSPRPLPGRPCGRCIGSPHTTNSDIESAFEVRLSSQRDRRAFLNILDQAARGRKMHVDVGRGATRLEDYSGSIDRVDAEIWQGLDYPIAGTKLRRDPHDKNHAEAIVLDLQDGRAWLLFLRDGEAANPALAQNYREHVLAESKNLWGGMAPLKI